MLGISICCLNCLAKANVKELKHIRHFCQMIFQQYFGQCLVRIFGAKLVFFSWKPFFEQSRPLKTELFRKQIKTLYKHRPLREKYTASLPWLVFAKWYKRAASYFTVIVIWEIQFHSGKNKDGRKCYGSRTCKHNLDVCTGLAAF